MNNAENYSKYNKISHRDTTHCLEEYLSGVTWNKDSGLAVVDVGCGDGSVTSEILKNYLPNDFKELVGCDISEEMVRFATEHYADQRINFQILDIGGILPEQYRNHFDHVFSFYALHWVQNQQKAFSNIYDMLAPGGFTLVTIIADYPSIYNVYIILSRLPKWSKYLNNVKNIVSPYHECPEADTNLEQLVTRIGFTDIEITRKTKSYCHGSSMSFKDFVRGVNGFPIPEEVFEDYLNDFVEVAFNMGLVDQNYQYNYDCFIFYGKKPE